MSPAKKRIVERLRKCRSYVVVTWDGEKFPVFSFNVEKCGNEKDVRHFVMQDCAAGVARVCNSAFEALLKSSAEEGLREKVLQFKDERSTEMEKELSGEAL